MAKTPVLDSKASDLKKELQRLVRSIINDDEYSTSTIDQATDTLCALRQFKLTNRSRHTLSCPVEYRCPLSKEMMTDPVVVSTGQTYDRPFIQRWLKAGNRTCPLTEEVLTHTILTPNYLIGYLISQWCKNQGIELSDPDKFNNEDGITEADRDHFLSLLEKMSSTLPEQKEAAKELRTLTKRMPSFRALFGESLDAIPQLLNPLSKSKSLSAVHPDLQEDVITTVLNLSIHDNNKKFVAETPMVIPLLTEALRSGTIETRSNAAAAIFTLSAIDSNKDLIGKSGALKPLIDLLDEGHPLAMKDVASAIFNLCIIHENKVRAVRDGAARVIVKKIMNGMHVDELVAILAMLANHQKAIDEMGDMGAVPCLFTVIRGSTCARNKQNCIAILYTICINDRAKWKENREEENSHGTISDLAQNGTSRAKRKASAILERLNRLVNITHTA